MPITLQCTCGKQFKVLDELAGKRVQCPGCKQPLAVPGSHAAGAGDDLPSAPRDDAPLRARKNKKRAPLDPQTKKMLVIGGSVGGVLLLLSCCCLGGVGAWSLFLNRPGDVEEVIIGRWTLDVESRGNTFLDKEFRKDGTYVEGVILGRSTWRKISKTGNTMMVEVKTDLGQQFGNMTTVRNFEVTPLSNQLIEIKDSFGSSLTYRRQS